MLARGDEVAVVVAELDVGGEDGIIFLANARLSSPDTVRMVLSAKDRFTDALNALNTGRVFRYIKKPCPPEELARFLVRGVQHYRELVKDRRAMRNSLVGSVKALVDILDLVNPEAMGCSKRIRCRVMEAGKALDVTPLWRLELAVTLSHIGCVALPGEILEKMERGEDLNPEEMQIFGLHPRIAANLLTNIDQMTSVAEIIRQQRMPLHKDQPLEARIIKVALDLDRMEHKGADADEILRLMRKKKDSYDPAVVETMLRISAMNSPSTVLQFGVEALEEGMVMAVDLVNKDGVKLLLRGQPLSKASLVRVQAFSEALGIIEPVLVEANGGATGECGCAEGA